MGNTREVNGNAAILARINKGWKPNRYLTNMSMAYFADPKDHVATSIFPICPVDFSTGFYYDSLSITSLSVMTAAVCSPRRNRMHR